MNGLRYTGFMIFPILLLLGACAGQQTMSNYARTGDTVSMAISETEPAKMLRKENVEVVLEDAAGIEHPVRLRNLFRIYADPTSAYAARAGKMSGWDATPMEVYSAPHQGQWMAVVDLVNPQTDSPPTLATGQATLWFFSAHTQWVASSLEILPGMGNPNPLYTSDWSYNNYQPVDTLEPMPQVQVTANGTLEQPVGGGMFVLRYVDADFGGAHVQPRVVQISPDPNIQLASRHESQGDGTTLVTVMLVNPNGFMKDNAPNGLGLGMSLRRDLRFTVAWDKSVTGITDANWQDTLQLVTAQYVNLDGNPVEELTPVLTKLR